jgi:IS5 family transposase
VDTALTSLGVKTVAIPRRGRPGAGRTAIQRGRRFVRLVKWRTGSEARINCLKRDWGWRRTLLDSHSGAEIWCGWGVLAHNATKITHIQSARAAHPRRHGGTDPPGPRDPTATDVACPGPAGFPGAPPRPRTGRNGN